MVGLLPAIHQVHLLTKTLFHKYIYEYNIILILKRSIIWSGRLSWMVAQEDFGEVSAVINESTILV